MVLTSSEVIAAGLLANTAGILSSAVRDSQSIWLSRTPRSDRVKAIPSVFRRASTCSTARSVASAAAFCAQPGFCVYAASKAYVLRFSQGLAAELKKQGILVTAVCPGPVRTEFFDRAGALAASEKEALCAEPEAVVTQALTDSVRGRRVSVYGAAMKGSRILSKILPDRLLVWGMMKINHVDI